MPVVSHFPMPNDPSMPNNPTYGPLQSEIRVDGTNGTKLLYANVTPLNAGGSQSAITTPIILAVSAATYLVYHSLVPLKNVRCVT